jgi:hypothetical protein
MKQRRTGRRDDAEAVSWGSSSQLQHTCGVVEPPIAAACLASTRLCPCTPNDTSHGMAYEIHTHPAHLIRFNILQHTHLDALRPLSWPPEPLCSPELHGPRYFHVAEIALMNDDAREPCPLRLSSGGVIVMPSRVDRTGLGVRFLHSSTG